MYVEVENLRFKYNNSTENILKDISFSVQKGDIVCILGESGSGKSTVLRLLAGLEVPDQGIIKVNNNIMNDEQTFILPEQREIGVVFQDYALFPHMTVKKNILFGIKNKTQDYKNKKLQELLQLISLEGVENKYPHQLSGGQQQRIALARSLAIEPSLIVMDEPFSSLDANLQAKIRGQLEEIIKQTGITSIFVSHDKEDAINIADKVIILDNGNIIQQGNTKDIIDNPSSDYVAGLFA